MNICIPVEKNDGMNSAVYGHFGSAPFFAVCGAEDGKVSFIGNAGQQHEHGKCNPLGAIAGHGVGAVLVGGIGAGALQKLNAGGIKVYRAPQGSLAEALKLFKAGSLPELKLDGCCHGHDGHACH